MLNILKINKNNIFNIQKCMLHKLKFDASKKLRPYVQTPSLNLSVTTDIPSPRRIYLIRHGESWGNIDESVFERIHDSQIPLTPKGVHQAGNVGYLLRDLIGVESTDVHCSPYVRARQTADIIVDILNQVPRHGRIRIREDPRLREQDFGNLQTMKDISKYRQEREYCGAFYYRFPQGESGSDVYNRVATYLDSLEQAIEHGNPAENLIIITHGMTLRLLLMKYFRWTVGTFHKLWNPVNCQLVALERMSDNEMFETSQGLFPYKLLTPLREDDREPPNVDKVISDLFTRSWGTPKGAKNLNDLTKSEYENIIKHNGWGWSLSTSNNATLLNRNNDEHGKLTKEKINEALEELKGKQQLVENERKKLREIERELLFQLNDSKE